MRLILASGSTARRTMLAAAGLNFEVAPAPVDEAALKAASQASPNALALELAAAKAQAISTRHPDALVIGADQILLCDGQMFDKPQNLAAAAAHLRTLRGRPHTLVTAVCVAQAGALTWTHVETPTLKMRNVSEAFLADYLQAEGPDICACVGAYRLEGRGINLFDTIEGDYFSVLGMPLLALLGFLRAAGATPA
jgi:septum formation protein